MDKDVALEQLRGLMLRLALSSQPATENDFRRVGEEFSRGPQALFHSARPPGLSAWLAFQYVTARPGGLAAEIQVFTPVADSPGWRSNTAHSAG